MSILKNTYHGILKKSLSTESFDISITQHQEGSIIPLHAHDRPYLCFSISGLYKEKSTTNTIIKPGTVLYRNANYIHENEFGDHLGLCLNIEFKDPNSMSLLNEFQFPDAEFERKATSDISKLMVSLSQNTSSDMIDIQCYESVFAHFAEETVKGKLQWINQVIEYIHDNPMENISIELLSRQFQLHPNYIIRKFKEVTGYTLSEYLTKIRIEHSIQDLIHTKNSISSVALDNGFYDHSHFNRAFKKTIGTSPMKFKRLLRG